MIGYEIKLYVGHISPVMGMTSKRVRVKGDFLGQPHGATFNVYNDEDGEYFYLADGNTRIPLKCARKTRAVEVLPESELSWFSTIAVLDLSKAGHPNVTPDDIICEHPELYVGNYAISEDLYGTQLVVYNARAMLRALRELDDGKYWRYKLAIQTLETIIEGAWQDGLGVICYGY